MKKRITALIMGITLAFSLIGCSKDKGGEGETPVKEATVDVWTATGMEKILQGEDYSSRFENKTLSISAFRNEYEAGQIILSADNETKTNVEEYDLALADLKSESGEVLPKASWTVYNQMYTHVTKVLNTETGLRPGWYPDGLLPFETAKEYGENSITWKENQEHANQGIWLTVKPAKNLSAGVYTGNFDLTVDGATVAVPVSVRIYDYTLGDYTHTKSSYAIDPYGVAYGELDATAEMLDTYYEFLLDHRINPQNLQVGGNMQINLKDPAIMEAFLQEACEVSLDPRWTSFNLPFTTTTKRLYVVNDGNGRLAKLFTLDSSNEIDFELGREKVTPEEAAAAIATNSYKSTTVVDFDNYEMTLLAIAQRSLSESLKNISNDSVSEPIDIMAKAATYFIFYDEFDGNGTEATASYCQERAWEVNQEVAMQLETLLTCTEEEAAAFEGKYGVTFAEYKANVINACKYLKNKVVGNYSENLLATHGQYVPQINYPNDPVTRENFINYDKNSYGEENGELWVYTCCFPRAPFSTLHVDDHLISSRIYGWLMYEYNAVGHLYWASTLNTKRYITSAAKDNQLMDFYTDPLRFPSANGDGFLMYAGREYGIYGPIDTVRLQSLRDGVEDYDLLYELEEIYKKRGVTGEQFDTVYAKLHENLHNSMKINYAGDILGDFMNSRDMLANLLENAYSDNAVIVENYEVKRGVGNVTVSAKKGVSLTCNGNTATGSEYVDADGNAFVRYEFTVALDGNENVLSVVANGSEKTEIKLNLGGRSQIIGGETLKNVIVYAGDGSCVVTNDGTVEREVEGETVQEKVTQFTLSDYTVDEKQRFTWSAEGYSFNAKTKKVTLSVYSELEASFEVTILVKTKSSSWLMQLSKATVQKGWNEVEISMAGITFGGADDLVQTISIDVEGIPDLRFALGSVTVEG